MTQFIIANIGSYPRIGEDKDQQRHRRGFSNYENKELSAHAFRDVEQSVIQEIIREQIACGLDEVTDGLIGWQDPISHFCKNISGIKTGGLLRYFDTNFYYRVPVISSKPRWQASVSAGEYEFAKSVSSKPLRCVLTGPYTLALHTRSSLKPYDKLNSRLDFFGSVIAGEIGALIKQGASLIQIDEPAVALVPEDFPLFRKAFEKLAASHSGARLILSISLGPSAPLFDRLRSLPLHGLHLDFTYDGAKLLEKIMTTPHSTIIDFGLVNGRVMKTDPPLPIINILKSYIEKFHPPLCRLTPSNGLEFLPRDAAIAKLTLMAKIKEDVLSPIGSQTAHD